MTIAWSLRFALPIILFRGDSTAAHHAFAPDYDGKPTVTVEGVVREFKFITPHAKRLIDVAGPDGTTFRWTFS